MSFGRRVTFGRAAANSDKELPRPPLPTQPLPTDPFKYEYPKDR